MGGLFTMMLQWICDRLAMGIVEIGQSQAL
jgi:hypothetical protein